MPVILDDDLTEEMYVKIQTDKILSCITGVRSMQGAHNNNALRPPCELRNEAGEEQRVVDATDVEAALSSDIVTYPIFCPFLLKVLTM